MIVVWRFHSLALWLHGILEGLKATQLTRRMHAVSTLFTLGLTTPYPSKDWISLFVGGIATEGEIRDRSKMTVQESHLSTEHWTSTPYILSSNAQSDSHQRLVFSPFSVGPWSVCIGTDVPRGRT